MPGSKAGIRDVDLNEAGDACLIPQRLLHEQPEREATRSFQESEAMGMLFLGSQLLRVSVLLRLGYNINITAENDNQSPVLSGTRTDKHRCRCFLFTSKLYLSRDKISQGQDFAIWHGGHPSAGFARFLLKPPSVCLHRYGCVCSWFDQFVT